MSIISEKIEGKTIMVEIKSSNIKSATYNTETENLSVVFNTGSVYEYNKVPWQKFTRFRLAESQGKFFNEQISKEHKFTKVK
jgi:KTSC domain